MVWNYQGISIHVGLCGKKVEGRPLCVSPAQERFRLLLVLYVDLLLVGKPVLVSQIKEEMKRRFDMHDLRNVVFYLGMKVQSAPNSPGSKVIQASQAMKKRIP